MKRRIQDRQPTSEKGMTWQRSNPTGQQEVARVEDLQARLTQKDIALHQAKTNLAEHEQKTKKGQEAAEQKIAALKTEIDELTQGVAKQVVNFVDVKTAEVKGLKSVVAAQEDGKYLITFIGPDGDVQITTRRQTIRKAFRLLKLLRKKEAEADG